MVNSSLEKDSEQICQVADWMFGFGLKHHVTQTQTEGQISRSAPLNAHNLIQRRPAGHFLPRPLGRTAGCGQRGRLLAEGGAGTPVIRED